MKRKFKLLTSVASLCVAVALMAFGVFAATNPSVKLSGTVSFTAKNVLAEVVVKVDGTQHGEKIVFDAATPESTVEQIDDLAIELNENKLEAVITVEVTSKQADAINVAVTDNTTSDDVNKLTYLGEDVDTVGAGATVTVYTGTFTATLDNTKSGAQVAIDVTIALTK